MILIDLLHIFFCIAFIIKYIGAEVGFDHHYCISHILELITSKSFNVPGGENIMKKARTLVQHFKSSTQANELLLSVQTGLGVSIPLTVVADCSTRWWSTYAMLERLITLKDYLILLQNQQKLQNNLTDDEWDTVILIASALKCFMVVQKFLEGEKYVTSCFVLFLIHKIRENLTTAMKNQSPVLVTLAEILLNDLNERFGNGELVYDGICRRGERNRIICIPPALIKAAFLDPRTKLLVGLPTADKELLYKNIKEECVQNYTVEVPQNENTALVTSDLNNSNINEELDDLFAELQQSDATPDSNLPQMDINLVVNFEIQKYMQEKVLYNKSNPLQFWKDAEATDKYPNLRKLAKKYLCIPATSAPTERLFSSAGLVITKKRNRLNDDIAEDCIFLKNTWDEVDDYCRSEEFKKSKLDK